MAKNEYIVVDLPELQVISRIGYDGITLRHYDRRTPNCMAKFAMELLRVHAGITGRENGEDAAGRQRSRRDTPAEAVTYACETAAAAFEEFKKRDWLIDMPGWAEIEGKAKPTN